MPDWSKYPTSPNAPPKTDWNKVPWSNVAGNFARNVVPDLVKSGVQGAESLVSSAAQGAAKSYAAAPPILQSDPVLALLAGTAKRAAQGSWNAVTHPAQTAKSVGQIAAQAGNYLKGSYGSPAAWKQTLSEHPAQPIYDIGSAAAAIGSLPEGGEGGIPLYSQIIRGARGLGEVANPVGMVAKPIGAAGQVMTKALRGVPLAADGSYTPKALSAINSALPTLTNQELNNPAFKSVVAKTMQMKGVSPAAARESVLTYQGLPTPKSQVTGIKAPPGAAAPTDQAIIQGRQAIGQQVAAITGQPSDPSVIGDALERSHNAAKASSDAQYDALRNMPGSFGDKLDPAPLNAAISSNLAESGHPSTPELLVRSSDSYPQTNKAVSLVNDSLANGLPRLGGQIDAPELMAVRRQLTDLAGNATGSDKNAVGSVISGFQDHIQNLADQGLFTVPTPAGTMASSAFPSALRSANQNYSDYFNTYQNGRGAAAPVKNAVAGLQSAAKQGLTNDVDAQRAAGAGIATRLKNANTGPATYNALQGALDDPGKAAVKDYIRGNTPNLADDGTLKTPISVDTPLASQVFTPGEQSNLRFLNAADSVLTGPTAKADLSGSWISSPLFRGAAGTLGAAAIGGGLAHFMPIEGLKPMMGELGAAGATSLMGLGLERAGIEPIIKGMAEKGALNGAPDVAGHWAPTASVAKGAAQASRAIPIAGSVGTANARGDEAAAQNAPPQYYTPPAVMPITDDNPYEDAPPPVKARTPTDWSKYPATVPGMEAPVTQAPPTSNDDDNPYADEQANGGRVPRASGGHVKDKDLNARVEWLMNLVDKAKKQSSQATKPLLNVPDNTIAKALQIAKERAA